MAAYQSEYNTLRNTFATNKTKSIKWRKWQLKQIWWMLEDHEQRFIDALGKDLGRHPFETIAFELRSMKADIVRGLEKVEEWSRGHAPEGAGFIFGTLGKAWLRKEPLGVCLVIGKWRTLYRSFLTH